MTICYTTKKSLWVKVAFILDRYGGNEKELSPAGIVDLLGTHFTKASPCTTSLTPRLRPQIREQIFEQVNYNTKTKTIKLIDHSVLDEHSSIMQRWESRIAKNN